MRLFGIDISEHQGDINIVALKGQVDYIILRAGWGETVDKKFERNYVLCKQHGIPVGAYWYSYALTTNDAVSEANFFINTMEGKQFEYPVYLDMEDADHWKENNGYNFANTRAISERFCEIVQSAGYYVGVYASKSWFDNYLAGLQNKYTGWIAHWGSNNGNVNVDYSNSSYHMHQYSSSVRLNGYGGNLDANLSFVDFPSIIVNGGFNGFSGESKQPVQPTPPVLKHQVGEAVSFGSCYKSSTSKLGWPPVGEALVPDIDYGVITHVYPGTNNPYLINDGMCFVNDGDIRSETVAQDKQYTVQSGDTLWDIAGVTLGDPTRYVDIKNWNGLSSDVIHAGQVLIIKE